MDFRSALSGRTDFLLDNASITLSDSLKGKIEVLFNLIRPATRQDIKPNCSLLFNSH
ncbi:MAG: hypothetical protein J6W29_00510 [Neisseriaceae bacterium]|nr:hypothetical protein [Neisseriaceae bacterium]